MVSSGASIEVSITIDDITHLLTWSPDGRVSLFRRERGELSTCGVGTWDGARIVGRPAVIRSDLFDALEAALRLALHVKRNSAPMADGGEAPPPTRRSGAVATEAEATPRSPRAKALRPLARVEAPPMSQRIEATPKSIDVVWADDEETAFFRRLVDPPA